MSFETPADRSRRRREISFVASVLAHAAVLLAIDAWPEAPPEPRKLEVELVRLGDPDREPGPPAAPETPDEVQAAAAEKPRPRPRQRRTAPRVAPDGVLPPAPEPGPTVAPEAPPEPQSFAAFQRGRTSKYLPSGTPLGTGGGRADGNGSLDVRGRDRCEPPPDRRFEVLYLLYDSSGSMSEIRRAQALSCAHQYARAAVEAGAEVVVGNFARGTTFVGPTRSMFDIEAALRSTSDSSATMLPSRELQPFLDRAPDADAELVIISDGMFPSAPDVLVWYRYYFEMNRENRAAMYTVGTPGYRPSVQALRSIGFDVFMYEQIRRPQDAL